MHGLPNDAKHQHLTPPALAVEDPYLSPSKAAKLLDWVARKTLDNWRSLGRGPRYIRLSNRIYYRVSDPRKWLDTGEVVEPNHRKEDYRGIIRD